MQENVYQFSKYILVNILSFLCDICELETYVSLLSSAVSNIFILNSANKNK
jgi:hypothetical protein